MRGKWEKIRIVTDSGDDVTATAPVIISASRSTDIPALYADWFFHRLRTGYLAWISPFYRQVSYISLEKTRAVVFWSKNPAPLLDRIDGPFEKKVGFAVQYTLNDYEQEGFEPGVPSLDRRIEVFSELAAILGPERIVWRFDPVLVAPGTDISDILQRVREIGDLVSPYTRRLVISFIDINRYRKVSRRLKDTGIREPGPDEQKAFLLGVSRLNQRWGLRLSACAEDPAGIPAFSHAGGCIDRELVINLLGEGTASVPALRDFLTKDPGQRKECSCTMSRDVGRYGSCWQGCVYCYATRSRDAALRLYQAHQRTPLGDRIGGDDPVSPLPTK